INSREVQDIVDQRGQAFALLPDDAKIFLVFFLGTQAPQLQSFGIEADQSQRCTQFVRNVRDEVGFQSREIHFSGNVAIREPDSSDHEQRQRTQNNIVVSKKPVSDIRDGHSLV